jgi:hypothetical protein
MHERTYRVIFGSQISLLLVANSPSHPDVAAAQKVYEDAKASYPQLYENFAFTQWLDLLIRIHFVTWSGEGTTQRLHITPLGRDFPHYLVNRGLTEQKYG